MKRPVQLLADILKKKQLTIAFAESITCGLLTHTLGTVSDTSEFLRGSIICYDESVKKDLLNINNNLIKKYTAESQQVTDAMVINLQKRIEADIYGAITGLAAKGGSETKSKPVGTVFYSVRIKNKLYRQKKKYNGSPQQIKKKSCDGLFTMIAGIISSIN